jgi:hypothetical protein
LWILNALLLATAPIVAALMATVIVIAVKSVGRVMAVTGSIVVALLGFVVFGSFGSAPGTSVENVVTFESAGLLAFDQRSSAVQVAGK